MLGLFEKLIENPRASILLFLAFLSITILPCYMIYRVEGEVNRARNSLDTLAGKLECGRKIQIAEATHAVQH